MIIRSEVKVQGIHKEILLDVKDDYSSRNTEHFDAKFILADLLVTRLGCNAYVLRKKDEPDKYIRNPK